jgi:hypothetical protein
MTVPSRYKAADLRALNARDPSERRRGSVVPGATALTRIPACTWSAAIASVNAGTAPLLAL